MERLDRDSKGTVSYKGGSFRDRTPGKGIYSPMPMNSLRRLAQRYEYGQLKYGKSDAYKDGLPVLDCMDSLLRHAVAYMDGDNSEDHMAAIAWNAFAVMFMEEENPKWQDIKSRSELSKENGDFEYLRKELEKC